MKELKLSSLQLFNSTVTHSPEYSVLITVKLKESNFSISLRNKLKEKSRTNEFLVLAKKEGTSTGITGGR